MLESYRPVELRLRLAEEELALVSSLTASSTYIDAAVASAFNLFTTAS
jgi:hypothetical protein